MQLGDGAGQHRPVRVLRLCSGELQVGVRGGFVRCMRGWDVCWQRGSEFVQRVLAWQISKLYWWCLMWELPGRDLLRGQCQQLHDLWARGVLCVQRGIVVRLMFSWKGSKREWDGNL